MKIYVTVTAPTKNAKATVARQVAHALRKAGFENVFENDPDYNRRSVGLFPIEGQRLKEWAKSQSVYVNAVQRQIPRENGVTPAQKEAKQEELAQTKEPETQEAPEPPQDKDALLEQLDDVVRAGRALGFDLLRDYVELIPLEFLEPVKVEPLGLPNVIVRKS